MNRVEKALAIGRKFVADESSVMSYGLGASVDFSAFTDPKFGTAGKRVIPAGTVVELSAVTGKVVAYDGTGQAYLTAADALEQTEQGGSWGTVGLIVGGVIYENLLPDADGSGNLTNAQKTGLGANFVFQDHPTSGVLSPLS